MQRPTQRFVWTLALAALSGPLAAQSSAPSTDIAARIKDEGLNRSQAMATLSYLTDVIGPRLTATPAMKRANEWTRDKMSEWGLSNAHLESWGPFGRGWTLERFSIQVVSPYDIPLIAYPKAWSPGWKGTGDVIYLDAKDENDLAKYKGKLKGAIVLISAPRELKVIDKPLSNRYTDEQLERMANGQRPEPREGRPGLPPPPKGMDNHEEDEAQQTLFAGRKARFLMEEGAAVLIDGSRQGDGGTIFIQQASVPPPAETATPTAAAPSTTTPTPPTTPSTVPGQPGARAGRPRGIAPWDKNAKMLPQISLAAEHYNRLVRMIQQGEKLKMELDLRVKYNTNDSMGYNTIAELPGTDKKDEVVMLGAHMDCWQSGTGATDNGVGCAVVMEAMRILKSLNIQPRRTIRVGLWSGEEQGLFGSTAYVAQHFGPATTSPAISRGPSVPAANKPEFDKFSAYYNLDNGTGKIRGIYAQGNKDAAPLFQEWLTPFADMGAKTVTMGNTGSTDHIPFDRLGLPGFQFIQDSLEYGSRTHHSNQDVYDRIQADDVKQAAIIIAYFAYQTAMRDELLPRKPAPGPRPASP